jgi:hypothetical protein
MQRQRGQRGGLGGWQRCALRCKLRRHGQRALRAGKESAKREGTQRVKLLSWV